MLQPRAQRMSRTRYISILVPLALLLGAGLGTSLAALRRQTIRETRIYEAHVIHTFVATRRLVQTPSPLEAIDYASHGGKVEIEWYCGSWAPLKPGGRADVSLYIDGRLTVSTSLNGSGGLHNARAGILRWVGALPRGNHKLSAVLDEASGGVALPLVRSPARVPEGLSVTEYAG
jgi:hypothetical protein